MSDLNSRLTGLSPEKRALLAKRLRQSGVPAATDKVAPEPLAIVGVGCRFPGGANSPDEYWRLIADGVVATIEVPPSRWDVDAYYDADPSRPGKTNMRHGGFIDGVDEFDATFFGISPREAEHMDPQQRLLLETTWSALEHAGVPPDSLKGTATGVFVGVHSQSADHQWIELMNPEQLGPFSLSGAAHNFFSGRISYMLDAHGPSLVVDTACSSSLVAVHLAMQSLRSGECSLAIAAGVNVVLLPLIGMVASRMHLLARDGRCKTFDISADGMGRGEGCGVAVIKRLSDAVSNGDRVLAVIRGSAVNQDGRTNGITAPNGLAQQAVVRDALRNAGVDPAAIGYVEAHGTGTPLGDPIEVEALAAALGTAKSVTLGSVKSNIGHLEGAAGIAGLIKTTLCLHQGQLPPLAGFTQLNPQIQLRGTPLVIPTASAPWPGEDGRRFAGVSSFGWSGTNAHVVLESAQPVEAAGIATDQRLRVIPLSARSPEALTALGREWQAWSQAVGAGRQMADIGHSAARRRTHYEYRAAVIATTGDELPAALAALSAGESHPQVVVGRGTPASGVVFVFPGQGSQWLGMGRELYATEPAFRAAIDACQTAIAPHVDWSLIEQLQADAAGSRLSEIQVVQPTLFAIEVALAALWRSWGIVPDAVVGHSMGEVAAAFVAGALTLEDAARVICLRSQLLRRVSGRGAMAVIELSLDETAKAITGYETRLSIAVSNSPSSTVISGDVDAIEEVLGALQRRDVFCRPIKVDVASHSPQVDPLRADLLRLLEGVAPRASSVPIYSTVTATPTTGAEFDAEYWTRNLRQPVLFSKAVERLAADGNTAFVEMSPHPILLPAIETGLRALQHDGVVLPSTRREEPERLVALTSAARLFAAGHALNWEAINGAGSFVDVPRYPYQRERFSLVQDAGPRAAARVSRDGHAFLGTGRAVGGGLIWEAAAEAPLVPAFDRCRFNSQPLLAPAVLLDAALEAARVTRSALVTQLEFVRPLLPRAESAVLAVEAQTVPDAAGTTAFRIDSRANGRPTTHVVARLQRDHVATNDFAVDVERLRSRSSRVLQRDEIYERLSTAAWAIEGDLQALTELSIGDAELTARFDASAVSHRADAFVITPALGQACLDVAALAAGIVAQTPETDLHLPLRIGQVRRGPSSASTGWIVARPSARGEAQIDAVAVDDAGELVVALMGIELVRYEPDTRALAAQHAEQWLYEIGWERVAAPVPVETPARPATWILIADRAGVATALSAALSARGERVTIVPADRVATLPQVISDCAAGGSRIGIVHLGSLDLPDLEAATPFEALAPVEQALQDNSAAILTALQTVTRNNVAARIWIVTRGAQPVGQDMPAAGPLQSTVWGLGRVIAEEHLESWGGLIDLDPNQDGDAAAAYLALQLQANDGERQVAVRGADRYAARFIPLAPPATPPAPMAFRHDASYLVTGAFGGVGFAAARWMVQQGARRLVLLGRTPLPPRDQWSRVDPASAAGQRVAAVRELESMGASVHVAAVDVADATSLAGFWREFAGEGWPPIRGIIHAAVLIEDGLLSGLNPRSFTTVMRPKVSGSWLLHELTKDQPIDFFVMFSSVGSVIGQMGQGNYAAANAFLDALAHYRRARGLAATSINWGGWREAGLGAASEGARRTIRNMEAEGVASFTTAQGLAMFGHLLATAPAQAIVMPVNWERFRASHVVTADPRLFASLTTSQRTDGEGSRGAADFRTELERTEPERRREFFEHALIADLAQVLRLPASRIDPQRPLGQLGLESLMALEFRNRLEARLGLKISATVVWNHPTVHALARHLASRIGISLDQVDEASETAAATAASSDIGSLDEMSEEEALRALSGAEPGTR